MAFHASCGKRHADDGAVVFASDVKLAGIAEEKFEACDEIAETVLGRDGVKRKAGTVVEHFKLDALQRSQFR